MKVYIVFTNDGESEEILQVYKHKEHAKELVEDNEERWPTLPYYYRSYIVQDGKFHFDVEADDE